MKLSDYVMKFLRDQDIKFIFGYIGGSTLHLIDSLNQLEGLTYIQNYHEQASSFSADAYSRSSGNIGVAIATSGPGATNLITGIANAFYDSVPCLFITGQVSVHHMKKTPEIRQQGFQETDIVSIVKPITKFAKTLLNPEMIRYDLEKAFHYAKAGRPGPVLIDIPHNLQASEIEPQTLHSFFDSNEQISKNRQPDMSVVKQVASMLAEAKRPVILAGGGVGAINNTDIFETFVKIYDLPVVCSLMGLSSINHDDKHFCGFIGSYGNRYANFAVAKSDLLLVLGSRLDDRQIGDNASLFARDAKIIHVDIDPYELNHKVCESISICCDIKDYLNVMIGEIGDRKFDNKAWLDNIHAWREKYPSYPVQSNTDYIDPNECMYVLSQKLSNNVTVCVDVGQHQMWVAQSFSLAGKKQFITSGGHGAMGYSLPAGVGAYFASSNSDRQIICIMGDGSIQMSLYELQTISREEIPLKIFVLNNSTLGMVRIYQEKYFNDECIGTADGYTTPDFEKLAYAYNIAYTKVETNQDFDKMDKGIASKKPHFFEIILSPSAQIIPEPFPGRAVEDQFPLLDRNEFNKLLNMD